MNVLAFCMLMVLSFGQKPAEQYRYTFRIDDACTGKVLSGVLVSAGGGTCTTGGDGTCQISLPKNTSTTIETSKAGYTPKKWEKSLLSLKGNWSGMVPDYMRRCGERK